MIAEKVLNRLYDLRKDVEQWEESDEKFWKLFEINSSIQYIECDILNKN